jgi:peptidoglycan/LPS O-acetylase OafA/YrhL
MQLLTLSSFRKSRSFRIIGAVFAVLGIAYAVYSATLTTALPQLAKAKVRIKWQKGEIMSLTSRREES